MHVLYHMLNALASSVGETLWPTRCVGCDMPGTLLCPECRSKLPYIDARSACPRCGAPFGMTDCTECHHNTPGELRDELNAGQGTARGSTVPQPRREFPFAAARAAVSYEGVAKRLITAYKDHDERRLDEALSELLAQAMRGNLRTAVGMPPEQRDLPVTDWTHWANALVPVPASTEALRRRGFDHMGRIARLCAMRTGLPCLEALRQVRRVHDQRALGAEQRARNRSGSFALAGDAPYPLPARIVLVDDVLTTGATASAAAEALLSGGARCVVVATCARVW